jgi:hypothetical protein
MNMRIQFILIGIMLVAINASAASAETGYFEKFYRAGPLQRMLLAQATPAKKLAPPPKGLADEKPLTAPPAADANKPSGGLGFDNPELGPPPTGADAGLSVGPLSNLVVGGTLDYRFLFPKEMPEGMFMIHVNELFVTTNIGDNISILAEQLLLTSDLATSVGQDHGFVYATISNLSFLPEGSAIRVGRMRLKYGIDAKLDAPANPLRTMEYRTIGLISDRAIEYSGYTGFVEYTAAVSVGPDFILKDVTAQDGTTGLIKVDANNRTHPFIARIGTDFKGATPNLGLSYYTGQNYRVVSQDMFQANETMVFGGFVDQHSLVSKERASADLRWGIWKLKFAAEYTTGTDSDSVGRRKIQAYYFRTDYSIKPQKIIAQVQYDSFNDGLATSPKFGSVGLGLTYFVTDASWVRAFYQADERNFVGDSKGGSVAGTQFLLAF